MKPAIAVILAVLLAAPALFVNTGCSSRPKATAEERLYYNHGGDYLRRKRTEVRQVEKQRRVRNPETGQYETVIETGTETVTILEIETADGQIIDYATSVAIANRLREGQEIPSLSRDQAAAAGLIGECVLVTQVVEGGAAHQAGIQEDDLIISYNGERALGYRTLVELVSETSEDDEITIVVQRDDRQIQMAAKGGYLGAEMEDYWR